MRRVVAAILYNIVVVLAICSSLGVEGSSGGVQVYPSVSFNVVGATEATYRDFLEAVREVVTRRTSTVNGLPVLNPEASVVVANRFLLVHLINTNTVTLAIDVTNLYVVAFSGGNNRSFFFKDSTALQRNNLFVGTVQTPLLTFTGNYISLESQPGVRARDNLPLGPTPLADAITRMWFGGSVAEPLLVVIQMVSEAARFRYIDEQVRKSITGRNTFTPKGLILSMQNSWSSMSLEVQRSPDGERFIQSVQLQDDNYRPLIINDFSTLSRYTMVAILLHRSTSSYNSYNALAEE